MVRKYLTENKKPNARESLFNFDARLLEVEYNNKEAARVKSFSCRVAASLVKGFQPVQYQRPFL